MSTVVTFVPSKTVPRTVTDLTLTVTGAPDTDTVTGQIVPSFGNTYSIRVFTTDSSITGYTGVITYKNKCCKTISTNVTFQSGITGEFFYSFVFSHIKSGQVARLTLTAIHD